MTNATAGLIFEYKNFQLFSNKLYGYADDSTLEGAVPSPGERVDVSESMNLDLNRVSMWCNLCGMKLK